VHPAQSGLSVHSNVSVIIMRKNSVTAVEFMCPRSICLELL